MSIVLRLKKCAGDTTGTGDGIAVIGAGVAATGAGAGVIGAGIAAAGTIGIGIGVTGRAGERCLAAMCFA
jgi:hypothetical protein